MFGRLLDKLDEATRPVQYIAAFLYGLARDELDHRRLRREASRS